MKIGIDVSQSVYLGTGVAAYTRNLVKALLAHSVHEYVLFGSAFRRQAELMDFISELKGSSSVHSKIFNLPPSVLAFLWNRLHIAKLDRFTGPLDVFHTSDWTEPPTTIPKVTTIHDVIIYKYPEHFPEEIIDNHKARFNWVKKESEAVIADSESTKRDIIEYVGIPKERIHVVHLGISEEYYPQRVDEIIRVKKKYHIQGKYILSIGTREPRKNLPRTIKAFERLNTKDYSLVIGGNFGWGEDLGKIDGVNILGFVDQRDLPALYSGASSFVYPSLYEGFGFPVLEALSCGVPVVTSHKGSLGEIAEGVAIEVNPESVEDITGGIKKVINLNKKERNILINKGIKHAAKFTWENTAKKTIEVYKKII